MLSSVIILMCNFCQAEIAAFDFDVAVVDQNLKAPTRLVDWLRQQISSQVLKAVLILFVVSFVSICNGETIDRYCDIVACALNSYCNRGG